MTTPLSTPASKAPHGEFAKVLRFRDLVIYGLVYVAPIGPWGTFAYVYDLSGGQAVLAYLAGIVCMFLTASSYQQIVSAVPGPGSVYAYAREALGTGAGFLSGWMVLLDYMLVPALMYLLAAVALNTLIPDVPRPLWILMFAAFSLAVNWFGIRMTARVNLLFLAVQFAAVAGYVCWIVYARGSLAAAFPVDALLSGMPQPSSLFAATAICILAFLGFDAITTLSEEVRPEQRHLLGRSIVAVLLIIGAIALVQSWAMSGLANGYRFADLASGAYDMTGARVSPSAGAAMAWVAAIVTGVAITPPMLAAVARVIHAMAVGGQLPSGLAALHPRFAVPQHALLLATVISAATALAFVAQPDVLTGIVNFGALAAYAAVHVSVIVLLAIRRRSGRWIVHGVMPLLGIAVILTVASQFSGLALTIGIGWFILGALYYALLRVFRRRAAETSLEPA